MNLNKCVLSFLNTSSELIYRKLGDISGLEICDIGYKTGNEPPMDGWRAYDADIPFKAYDAHFWIRANFRTPAVAENEYLVLRTVTGREGMWDATNPQGLLYLNGKMVQGLDTNHTEAFLDADTEYILHNYFQTGTYPKCGAIQCKMAMYAVNKDIEHLYYDIKVPYDAAQMLDEGDTEYARIMSVLVDAVRLVDFREPYSESFNASVKTAIDFMEKEFY
jgi:alpha-mannosidase